MQANVGVGATLRRLGNLLAPHRKAVMLAACLTAVACLLNLPVPLLIQGLIDGTGSGSAPAAPLLALGLLGVFAAQAVIGLTNALLIGRVGLEAARDLRRRLYDRLQRLRMAFYDRTPAGAVISRLTDDVTAVQNLLTTQTLTTLTDLGTAAVVAGWMAWNCPRLLLVAALFLPAYLVLVRAFGRRIRAGTAEVRDRLDTIFGRLKEKVDAALVVKAHAREAAECELFAGEIEEAHAPRVHVGRLGVAFSNLGTTLGGVGAAVVFAVGAFEVLAGRMTPGEVVSASALSALLFGPLGRLADLSAIFQQARASLERLGEILEGEPEVAEPEAPVPLGRARGHVEFDRVSHAYVPGRPAVSDIRLKVEPGTKVALVGPTGCGKTTLLSLLLRFYDPTQGEVRLDGVPVGRVGRADLRRQIGVVLQEPVVFRESLADNIRYGVPDATDERVRAAARAALVDDIAARLPDGFRTVVGEGGHKLSQGERQRVAIARAFCKDPAVILLDEATSSLDTASEAQIQAALGNLLRGRTAFIIAHRLSTIIDADRIVVMDGGRIVQVGTHAELLAERDGLYRRLCARQFGWTDETPARPAELVLPTVPAGRLDPVPMVV